MRSLLLAMSLLMFAAGTAFAQTGTSCPTGQVYDVAQKKCASASGTNSAKSNSGY